MVKNDLIEKVEKSNQEIILSSLDIEWLSEEYPSLKITSKKLKGEICIQRIFNDITILDCFNIEVNLKYNEKSMLPSIRCTDDRIENISKELNKKLNDLHINENGTFCLTIYPEEIKFFKDNQFNIQEYFKNLVEPFLYWVCYYEKYNKAPWSEYAHGYLGIIEYIGDNDISFRKMYKLLKKEQISLREILNIYRQRKCLCEECELKNKSQCKIRNCHPRIWQGIKKIKNLLCEKIIAIKA